ncbi:MAG TPA: MFS transporter, partial [Pyrinomonadaceae bacterium]|nr:MFS transporter [Pyrinomonadaceae bacterium]
KKKAPMMPLGLFKSSTFAGANLLTLFLYAGLGGLLFFLPFNLIQVQGYSPTAAGAALLPFVITMFALGRWAGGLVERYGSKIPLVVGPLIAGGGFALFALPAADGHSYWIDFFPAIMVMSVGMAVSVSPLTTTVMGAVEVRHAGLASGINNAVSRVAGLIAVAAFGVAMLYVFDLGFAEKLQAIQLPDEVRQNLLSQSGKFLNLEIPQNIARDTADAIRTAVRDSFVAGFRVVSLVSAVLAVLSSIASWMLIDGKTKIDSNSSANK